MHFSTLLSLLAIASVSVHAQSDGLTKLPYDTLGTVNCAPASDCAGLPQPVTCHCNPIATVCQAKTDNGTTRFCWGSVTLSQPSKSPPSVCGNSFNSSASCLSSNTASLCVDSYAHYCYATKQSDGSYKLASIDGTALPSQTSQPPAASATPSSSDATERIPAQYLLAAGLAVFAFFVNQ